MQLVLYSSYSVTGVKLIFLTFEMEHHNDDDVTLLRRFTFKCVFSTSDVVVLSRVMPIVRLYLDS